MYNDPRISYTLLVTAAWKAQSEQEVKRMEGARVKSAQAGEDEIIHGLQEQIAQLRTTIQQPPEKASNCNKHNADQKGNGSDTRGRNDQNRC